MNISGSDIATTATHLIGLGIAAIFLRGRLVEVAVRLIEVGARLAEMIATQAKNREVGQQRDRLWETLGPKLDENTREQRAGFDRLEQRFVLQDVKIATLEASLSSALERISSAEGTIKELAILIKVQP